MLNFSRESTHYFIISNIWIAASVLAEHRHDILFTGAFGLIWFVYGLWVSRKEREDEK
jgi:hypothetical protein